MDDVKRFHSYFKIVCDIVPEKTREFNEIGISQIYAEVFSDEIIYNVTAREWFYFDGIRWREDVGGIIAAEKPGFYTTCLNCTVAGLRTMRSMMLF